MNGTDTGSGAVGSIQATDRNPSLLWIHAIRALAVACVLFIHSSAEVFFTHAPFGGVAWWAADVYNSAARPCIPLLFMVSGCLLLGRTEAPGAFLRRRFSRVAVPLLFWSVVFIVWIRYVEFAHPSVETGMLPNGYLTVVHQAGWFALIGMFWCPVYYHLWFLYAILGLYLVMPLLQAMVRNSPDSLLWYFMGIWILAAFLAGLAEQTKIPDIIDLRMMSGNVPYLILGYLLSRIRVSRGLAWGMALLGLVCLAITIVGTYRLTAADPAHELNQGMWKGGPHIVALAVAVYLGIRYAFESRGDAPDSRLRRMIEAMSRASFGIYLIHVFFLYFLAQGWLGFRLTALTGPAVLFIPLVAVITYAMTYAAVRFLQVIPVVKRVIP